MKIKEMTEKERPRERLIDKGAADLSNGELLAILLHTGIKGTSALDLAQNLLSHTGGSLVRMSQMQLDDFRSIYGLGGMKAVPIVAALELGRRFIGEGMTVDKLAIVSPSQVFRLLKPALKGLQSEECWAVFLNSAHYVTAKVKMTAGGLNSTIVDIKTIAAEALARKAVAVILVHNHPSGNPRPGTEDIRQTELLRQALASLSITLMDHVVVCDDCYYSFADEMVYEG